MCRIDIETPGLRIGTKQGLLPLAQPIGKLLQVICGDTEQRLFIRIGIDVLGAGLVALAVPSSIRPAVATQLPEATYPLIADDDVLTAQSAIKLLEDMDIYHALLVGPGLYEAGAFLETLLSSTEVDLPPMVIDADGLNLLSPAVKIFRIGLRLCQFKSTFAA